ncbi:MAG TPA: hypothetical protein VJ927_09150 [Actinomycetota bacterium]|nr:hypothetical protein [Actinomycetota bacterium]
MTSDGAQTSGNSADSHTSADGRYVTFFSDASDLVPDDTNGHGDVFVRDTVAGTTERVSVSSDEAQANQMSMQGAISADGRYVAFVSFASNLTAEVDPTLTNSEVYLRDLQAGTTERITRAVDGGPSKGASLQPSVSADGRYVAFFSHATDLIPGDSNGAADVFVFDRETGSTEAVSVAPEGGLGDASSTFAQISDSGRVVVFRSAATNLIAGDENGEADVFLRDLGSDTTEIISVASDGTQGNADAFSPLLSLSSDDRFITFQSSASNLVPNDTNGLTDALFGSDVFVRDRRNATTERVSVTSSGGEFVDAFGGSISADGRFVAFHATRSDQDSSDFGAFADVYVHDRVTSSTEHVSVTNRFADPVTGDSENAAITADGRYVYFQTNAPDFVPGDGNEFMDIVRRERGPLRGLLSQQVESTASGARVSGIARVGGEVLAAATDGSGETGPLPLGADLTAASVVYRHEEGDLLFRLELDSMPNVTVGSTGVTTTGTVGGDPAMVYGVSFVLGGTRYEVRAQRASASEASAPAFTRYVCGTGCAGGGVPIPGGFGTTGPEIRMSLPAALMGLQPGEKLEAINAFVGPGEMATGAIAALDEIPLVDVTAPDTRVRLGRGPETGEGVVYEFDSYPFAGRFSEEFEGALTSGHTYWASVCLDDRCAAAERIVAPTTPGPEPTPTDTASPTVSPSLVPLPTTVSFTERSAPTGQHSDEALFEARVADSDGAPLEGAELVFELTGADSSRTMSAITDADGVGAIPVALEEAPGPYHLTVRYLGSEQHQPSADSTVFVVDKENTGLELVVSGKGKDKVLEVRLADHDSGTGIAGRTIDLYADGEAIGSVITDNDGGATQSVPTRYRGGRHNFEARFEGDSHYLGSGAREQG